MEDDERAFDRRGKLIGTKNDMRTIVRVLVHDAAGEGAASDSGEPIRLG